MSKRIRLNGLRQSTVGHTAVGLWRHPDSRAHEYRELSHWTEVARILERGAFDTLFIADALAPRWTPTGAGSTRRCATASRPRPTTRCWRSARWRPSPGI